MSDRLDDLLTRMPANPYPQDLVERVNARLAVRRRRSRRVRRVFHSSLVVVSLVGLWLIFPRAEAVFNALADLSIDPLEAWLSALVKSPGKALLNLSGTVVMWISEIASALDIEFVIALGILTATALYGVLTLVSNGAPRKEVMT
jgi:hypothetical protein